MEDEQLYRGANQRFDYGIINHMALGTFIVSLNDLINQEAKKQTGSCLGTDVFYFFLKRFFSDIREDRSPSLQSKAGQSPYWLTSGRSGYHSRKGSRGTGIKLTQLPQTKQNENGIYKVRKDVRFKRKTQTRRQTDRHTRGGGRKHATLKSELQPDIQ